MEYCNTILNQLAAFFPRHDFEKLAIQNHQWQRFRSFGKHYFIPNLTQGLNFSSFPGVYDEVNAQIDRISKEVLGSNDITASQATKKFRR